MKYVLTIALLVMSFGTTLQAQDNPPQLKQQEPLEQQPSDNETYRFAWVRAFNDPVVITFTVLKDGGATIHTKVIGERRMVFDKEHALTADEAKEFLNLLDKADFWALPTDDDRRILDGSIWEIEGVKDGKHHIVYRRSPEGGAYRDAGMFLIRNSGYKFKKDEIY